MSGARAVASVLLAAVALAGCGAAPQAPTDTVAPPEPAEAPPGGPEPAGEVFDVGADVAALAVDGRTRTLAVALDDRLLLTDLDDPQAPPRTVDLPGPAAGLTVAAPGGPLLVPVAGAVLSVPLTGPGGPQRTGVPGEPRAAVTVAGETVVALGDRLAVLGGPEVPGFAGADRLVALGDDVGVLDRGRTAVTRVDPRTGDVSAMLRAGDGASDAVADRYQRMLVTDPRDGELLVFAGDPLILRQRYPVPGAPYAIAYDPERDLAWVTLTARDEVVGLDVAGGEPVQRYRFPTVHRPETVAVDPSSGRVHVGSGAGAGLQVIEPDRVVNR